MLPKEGLYPRLSNKVWSAFMRSEFDVAVFQAMNAVEVAVREAAGLPNDLLGVKLMRRALDPKDGPLTDIEAEESEKEARFALFAGAIGSYRIPIRIAMFSFPIPLRQSRQSASACCRRTWGLPLQQCECRCRCTRSNGCRDSSSDRVDRIWARTLWEADPASVVPSRHTIRPRCGPVPHCVTNPMAVPDPP